MKSRSNTVMVHTKIKFTWQLLGVHIQYQIKQVSVKQKIQLF